VTEKRAVETEAERGQAQQRAPTPHFEDLTPQEVAARQGVPAATVRSHVRRGLAKLRGSLDERYGSRRASSIALLALAGAPRTGLAAGLLVAALAYVAGADRSRTDAGVERTAVRAEKPEDAPSCERIPVWPRPAAAAPGFPAPPHRIFPLIRDRRRRSPGLSSLGLGPTLAFIHKL